MRRRRRVLLVVALVFLAGAGAIVLDAVDDGRSWLGVNNGVVLYEGVEMLRGARLYVDWRDTNPPSIYLFTWLTAWLAATIGLPVVFCFYALVLLIGVVGVWLLDRVLAGGEGLTLAGAGALLGYALFCFHPDHHVLDFAEREHLFGLVLVPFLFTITSSRPPRRAELAWALAVGFFAMMKPHFLVGVVVAVGVATTVRRRLDSALLACLALGGVTPLVGLYLHSPESWRALFSRVLPLHLQGYYAYYRMPWTELLEPRILVFVPLTFTVLLLLAPVVRAGRVSPIRAWTYVGALAVMWAGALHQQKFWAYHFVPVAGLVMVGGGFVAGALVDLLPERRRAVAGPVFLVLASLAPTLGVASFISRTTFATRQPLVERILALTGPGASVLPVSTHVSGLFDPEGETVRVVGPWPGHFRLPGIVDIEDPEARAAALREYADALAARIHEARPELVLFSTSDALFSAGVSPYRLFVERYPVLADARYRRVDPAVAARLQLDGWAVFRRRDG